MPRPNRWALSGIIEGFYGPPWSWEARAEVLRFCHERGMTHYVYAPKDDPKHREHWREPYDTPVLDEFANLSAEGTLTVGFGLSPGLSIDYSSADDRAALAAKVDQVLDVGIGLVCLALDDIPFRPGLGEKHAELTAWLRDHLADRASLVLVPTEYVDSRSTPYLDALAAGVPDDVPIAWTGNEVVTASITVEDAAARAAAVGGRAPLIWDNYPVNDGMMRDRLHMGPLRGREPGLAELCSGYLANPMVQPRASLLALASIAAFLRGDDPSEVWAHEADVLGWRVFAEACDGAVPSGDALRPWLEAAAVCSAPGLEEEAGPWIGQVQAEAKLGLDALALMEATGSEEVVSLAFAVAMTWQRVRRGKYTVMGPRLAVTPVLGARPDGTWSFKRESVVEDGNAIDRLVRGALDTAAG